MAHLQYDRILVPTDMSDFANLALRYAAMFREKLGSALTLLYADELYLPVDLLEAPLGYYLENAPDSRQKIQARFAEYAKAQIGGKFETTIVQDSPSRAVISTAKAIHADLIIMGTHGRQGLRRALLGSVTENVLHETDIPVLTVTPALMRGKADIGIRRILCPVNFTHVARESLQHAAAVAAELDAELHVVYVIEGIDADRAGEVEVAFKQWIDPQVRNRCKFSHILVRDGDPAERVLTVADNVGADLIVVGAQHKFFSDATVIGTTTQRITRFAKAPVLTIVRHAHAEAYEEDHAAAAVS